MCSVGCWGSRVGSHSVGHPVSVLAVMRSLGDEKLAFGINAGECETHLRFLGSSLRYPPSLPSGHARHWILSFVRLERSIGSTVSSLNSEGTLEGKNRRGKDTIDVPFDTKRILQHFDSAHKVEFDIFEGPSLSFQKRNPSLCGNSRMSIRVS